MNEQLTDQVLIERIQNGDKQAFNLLVVKYQNKVCNLISRYVNNPSDVADVAQEAFIKHTEPSQTFAERVPFTLGFIVSP
ncbi:RNA polymerase sigma factor rpoE [Vibrio ishigakensis]|uniref:RNA polymerase sigma factor rpoE n=1 Tax=Vibrio ishigakensis TaxID=1481914 RepID=A0A0B8PRG3_9VIBR|nr:RNA polymerase sigma factor rpoE [Vibrio ishigakensis]